MPEPGIFTWGEAGNAECGNWAFGNRNFKMWRSGIRVLLLLTLPPFPEPESNWNFTLVVVALSVIAAIIIISLIGFGVWKLQCGKKERNEYSKANSEYQQRLWIRIQILSTWIP
ncbi:hypothetical protein WISP_00199 [Willisornis vidua]|uniref:Uncharacterized protein n=1 Tax=Willisornis vidua TaxID=1566151 RepID=A0ABQ9CP28_9PASS|nr:hypothetical protein WISP_00199 [Willisornis vidua]